MKYDKSLIIKNKLKAEEKDYIIDTYIQPILSEFDSSKNSLKKRFNLLEIIINELIKFSEDILTPETTIGSLRFNHLYIENKLGGVFVTTMTPRTDGLREKMLIINIKENNKHKFSMEFSKFLFDFVNDKEKIQNFLSKIHFYIN